ncbi:hypothetical protein Ga0466249_001417 [Sporomusaceae bacterium BoRhaA]|uniref:hypothetical protein n=1 Tax=Pelorhabdus rhamnosifermentans TaxID=2772457 RepID=UPI001C062DEE|nr:hypothetical protein [Pelorhabdus rhamnosifermentans]MBU2700325.1 hypothetical protein [Pelorhabdus rhamnosifermentans]
MSNSTLACGVVNSGYSQGVVSTVDSSGTIYTGVVTKEGNTSTNLSGDPIVNHFKYNGADYALIASYRYTTGSVGTAMFGIYTPSDSSSGWTLVVEKSSTDWGFSNPYGLVVIGTKLYVSDYDSGKITAVDLSSSSYPATTLYTQSSSPTPGDTKTYTVHGNGLDYYVFRGTTYLTALYGQSIYDSTTYSYTYTRSLLVIIDPTSGTATATVAINPNALSVTVDHTNLYAYVSSSGAAQQAGGNGASSKLQVVKLNQSTPAVTATLTGMTSPSTFGDFVDVAFVTVGTTSYAYVLLANYNSSYSSYTYRIIRTLTSDLQSGSFGSTSDYSSYITTVSPFAATWLLAPDGTHLWFVSGNYANMINTSSAISASVITEKGSASTLGTSTINTYLNTASVVIEQTTTLLKGGVPAAVSASRSKRAIRLLPPDKLKEVLDQTAAAKEK